jgi:hypothetical protein
VSLAAEISYWYQNVWRPTWGDLGLYAVVQMPSKAPFTPTGLMQARSREEAHARMLGWPRPTDGYWFLAVVGPYGIEATRP